ncbi:MAG: hypothetical protein ACTSP4_09380 [Candidatus Hodarchaeales archaeon]
MVKPGFNLLAPLEDGEGVEEPEGEDFGKELGSLTLFLLVIFVLPFIAFVYLKDAIQYLLFKIITWTKEQLKTEEPADVKKASQKLYFRIRRYLLNIHCIGAILACIVIVTHLITLFVGHNGLSFFFAWIAILSGIYLTVDGILLRFRWKAHDRLSRKTTRIARAIHLQIIVTSVAAISMGNNTLVDTGTWESGKINIISLDNLNPGIYFYDIQVIDVWGNNITRQTVVSVITADIDNLSSLNNTPGFLFEIMLLSIILLSFVRKKRK